MNYESLNRKIAVGDVLNLAITLASDTGENPEYDRALVEIVMYAAGGAFYEGDHRIVAFWMGLDLDKVYP